jgi:hypothetical protein
MPQPTVSLREFVAELMEQEGAVIERIEPEAIEYMAPAELQRALKLSDFGRLGFGMEIPDGAERVGFESDWLERFGKVLGERGRAMVCAINPQLPPLSSPERMLDHALTLQNAVYRLSGVARAWTRLLIIAYHYTATSDEKREGIIHLAFNLSTGSALDESVASLLEASLDRSLHIRAVSEAGLPERWTQERLNEVVGRALPARIDRNLTRFLSGMSRRLERDLSRLFDYYDGLRQESLARLRKHKGQEREQSLARERSRVEAITREYRAKVADLQQKYAMKIEVEQVQSLEIILPVHRFQLTVKRRKGERRIHLDWNPVSRRLDPPPCQYSYAWDSVRVVCDDALHLVSPAAHGDCPSCGKNYCRACSPSRCSKCGNRT